MPPYRPPQHNTTPSRLRPVKQDPLEAVGLPSKGDTSLRSCEAQARYFDLVLERWRSDGGPVLVDRDKQAHEGVNRAATAVEGREKNERSTASTRAAAEHDDKTADALTSALSAVSISEASSPINTRPSKLPPTSALRKTLVPVLHHLRKLREALTATHAARVSPPAPNNTASKNTASNNTAKHQELRIHIFTFALRAGIYLASPESYQPAMQTLTRLLDHSGRRSTLSAEHSALRTECRVYATLDALGRLNDIPLAVSLAFGTSSSTSSNTTTKVTARALTRAFIRGDYHAYWRAKRRLMISAEKVPLYDILAAQSHGANERIRTFAADVLTRAYFGGEGSWVRGCLGFEPVTRRRLGGQVDGVGDKGEGEEGQGCGVEDWEGARVRGWVDEHRGGDEGAWAWVVFRRPRGRY